MNSITAAEFEQYVRQAFAGTSRPSVEMTPDQEFEPLVAKDKHWWELGPPFVNPANAHHLSQDGLLYFMPLYLIATLRYEWETPTILMDLLYTPGTPTEKDSQQWWHKFQAWDGLMKRLSPGQKHAIRLWLELMMRQHPGTHDETIEEMLANYWGAG